MLATNNLNAHRKKISRLYRDSQDVETICNTLINQGCHTTVHAIRNRLQHWGLSKTPRPQSSKQGKIIKGKIIKPCTKTPVNSRPRPRPTLVSTYGPAPQDRGSKVPGPNFAWQIRCHRKLQRFGIQVSSAMDSYSGFILWAMVGVNACSPNNLRQQYLEKLETMFRQPRVIQLEMSDAASNIVDAHYKLRRAGPGVEYRVESKQPPLDFQDFLWYTLGDLGGYHPLDWCLPPLAFWEQYFSQLEQENSFTGSDIDKIALLAVYEPMIHSEIGNYVSSRNSRDDWEKNEDGEYTQPWMAYYGSRERLRNHSHVRDYELQIDPILLESLQDAPTPNRPVYEYLEPSTLEWCKGKLQCLNFDPIHPDSSACENFDIKRPYRNIYLRLRRQIQAHHQAGALPRLSLSVEALDSGNLY